MAKPEDAGFGTATAGTLGAADAIREHASFGILTGTFASGVFPVGHGQITSDFVHVQDEAAPLESQPLATSTDVWLG